MAKAKKTTVSNTATPIPSEAATVASEVNETATQENAVQEVTPESNTDIREDEGIISDIDTLVAAPVSAIIDEFDLSDHEIELNKRIDASQSSDAPSVVSTEEDDVQELSDAMLDKLAMLVELYPQNPIFHFTSDGQVFLDKHKQDALDHERSLGGELESIEVH